MPPSPSTPQDRYLRRLPIGATVDDALHGQIDALGLELPESLHRIDHLLSQTMAFREYDAAVNHALRWVWPNLEAIFHADRAAKGALVSFTSNHLTPPAAARILRRLVKDPEYAIRARANTALGKADIREVALPPAPDRPWDVQGWTRGVRRSSLFDHPQGTRVQKKAGVPELRNVGELRELLGIKSQAQLGWFLLATDGEDGPYSTFTIPKRDGSDRLICAPKDQLRFVQRRLLDLILSKVPTHDAAHGFVPGRSTVTNAAEHVGADVLVKFDLRDFFPTIHYHRVMGLFASLGYPVEDGKFATRDAAYNIAPTLARLCTHTSDPKAWGQSRLPQGAPTSPAISNLISRGLDNRLTGLADSFGGGYTRYADDLTFSFYDEVPDLGRLRWWVDQIVQQEGFVVNQSKFRIIRSSQQQRVTGIVVNETMRVPRRDRRRFRAILHNCRVHGVASQARGHAAFEDYLRGFASYVHMVHPEEGKRLLAEVKELLGGKDEGGEQ